MTINWQDLDALVHACGKCTSLRDDKGSKPKGLIRGKTKNGQVLEVKGTNHLERCRIENEIDTMQKDGTQSWFVISPRIDKYVTVLPEENKKPTHHEEVAANAETLVALKPT